MQMVTAASPSKTLVLSKVLLSFRFPSSLQRLVLSLQTTSSPLGRNTQNKTVILSKAV